MLLVASMLMLVVYSLPTRLMKENVGKSLEFIENESQFEDNMKEPYLHLDMTTDRVMLNIAIYESNKGLVNSAFINYWFVDDFSKTLGLDESVSGNYERGTETTYGRYWNGYCVPLKILLCFFTYQEIRILNIYVQLILIISTAIFLYKKTGFKYMCPFILSLMIINPVATSQSLQYTNIAITSLIAMIVILLVNDRLIKNSKRYFVFFLVLGSCVSFFDFLTYPIVALGLPLIIYIITNMENDRQILKHTVMYGFIWGCGYIGMWAGKWVVGSIATGQNIIQEAKDSIAFRTVGEWEGIDISICNSLISNLEVVLNKPFRLVIILLALSFVAAVFTRRLPLRVNIKGTIALFLVSIVPIGWYIIVKNHSVIHYWMTFRDYTVLFFGIGCIVSSMIRKRNVGLEQK